MDDNDDAVLIEPDVNGFLDLTNRAWVNLDHRIWYSAQSLFVLDISYNNMFELPATIGDLHMLRELRAAFNKLIKLPPTIGKLKRLRRLVLNGNKLKHLPDEIGRLDQCEELILSENRLQYLPSNIRFMSTLTVLKLQNNDLQALPPELSEIATLKIIDVTNNFNLSMIPNSSKGDPLFPPPGLHPRPTRFFTLPWSRVSPPPLNTAPLQLVRRRQQRVDPVHHEHPPRVPHQDGRNRPQQRRTLEALPGTGSASLRLA